MKIYAIIFFVLGFGLKSLVNLLASDSSADTSATQNIKPSSYQRKQAKPRSSSVSTENTRELLKEIKTLMGKEPGTAIQAADDLKDPQAALELLLKQSGFSGLWVDDEMLAERLIVSLYEKNPDAAIAFIENLKNNDDRKDFTHAIIKANIKKGQPVEDTLKFAQQHQHLMEDKMGKIDLPRELYKAATNSSENFFQLCLLAKTEPIKDHTEGFLSMTKIIIYPEDFDFRDLLTKLSAHNQSLPEGQTLTATPDNLLSSWAKRDPNAAYEWVIGKQHSVPNNDNLNDFLTGYKKSATPEDMGAFLADRIRESPNGEIDYDMINKALHDNPKKANEVIKELSGHFPDQESKNRHLSGIIAKLPRYLPGHLHMLLSNMPREAHLDTIKQMSPAWSNRSLKHIYGKYGHSEQEIDEAIKTMRKPTKEERFHGLFGG